MNFGGPLCSDICDSNLVAGLSGRLFGLTRGGRAEATCGWRGTRLNLRDGRLLGLIVAGAGCACGRQVDMFCCRVGSGVENSD
jgi:hypothetical protein